MGANVEKPSTKTVLILGGGGFIGTNLAEHLLDSGHAVISVSRSVPSLRGPGNIEYVAADLAEPVSYAGLLETSDQVIYLASATTPGTSIGSPEFDIEANLMPFLGFLRLNAEAKRPVIFASSGGTVYGRPQYLPIDEEHGTAPISPYGIVKLTMEKYLAYFAGNFGFRHAILRIANPYGGLHHRRSDQGVIDVFARKILNNEELVIWGTGEVVRDYVHISDVCRSFAKTMSYTGQENIFNIGAGQGRSILQIVERLAMHADLSPRMKFEQGRDYDIRENVLNISRARSELGWEPVFDFDEGIVETLRNIA